MSFRTLFRSRFSPLLAAAVLGSFAIVGTPQASDLISLYRDALANDSQLAAARAQRDAGLERRVQARAGLLPQASMNANTQWNDGRFEGVNRNYESHGWSVSLSQPLLRWQNVVAARQGELQSALAELQFAQAEQDLILRVAQAYFDVVTAREALAAIVSLREAAAQQFDLANQSFEIGTVTITDVHEAQSRLDLAKAQEIAAQNQLEVSRQALARLTGAEAPAALRGLAVGAALPAPQPAEIAPWLAAARGDSLAVQQSALGAELAAREIERARAGHYPTVDVFASHSNSRGLNDTKASALGLQLHVPLYQGGAVQSRQREAIALHHSAIETLEDTRRGMEQSARQAYLGVTNGLAQVRALEAAEISSRSALEANQLGYEVGVRINIDVLNAQSQLADTRQRLTRARHDTLLALLRLKASTGALAEDDLKALNALLE